jgi:acetyl esterase/lipase
LLLASPGLAQQAEDKIQVERDIVFGKGGAVDLKLDLAMPKEGDGPFPAVLCIHGGGWRGGNRQQMSGSIATFAGRGYVAVTPEYRLTPGSRFPAQIEDCKAAVRWLRANAKKYKIDPDRIGAIGFSAGGHLACLLGTSDKNDGLEGNGGNPEQSSRLQAVVSFFGPTDLTVLWEKSTENTYLVPFLGGSRTDKADAYKKASPITYATKDDPPMLFIHGTEDKLVPLMQSKLLCDKLQSLGVPATLIEVKGEGHGWKGDKLFETIKQTMDFLDERLKK